MWSHITGICKLKALAKIIRPLLEIIGSSPPKEFGNITNKSEKKTFERAMSSLDIQSDKH